MRTHPPFRIVANHISVSRNGRTILNDITWEIREGQHWAVIGPNGAGKSVLMQVIQGYLPGSGGRMHYANGVRERIASVSFELHHRLVAYEQDQEVFREFAGNGNDGRTVRRLLEDGRTDNGNRADDLDNIVRMMGLEHLQTAPIATLSNGEMRKTLIARAMLGSPRILILDEPYDGLDTSARRHLTEIMHQLPDMGIQVILATHHMDEIPDIVTHMLCLDAHGHTAYQGEAQRAEMYRFHRRQGAAPLTTSADITESGLDETPDILATDATTVPVIVMNDITIVYGHRVILNKLNWTVRHGENWAVAGPNGAGKSTLLSLVSADNPQAYANEISLFGKPRGSGESIWDIKRRIGVLSPEFQIRYREHIGVTDVVLSGYFDSVGLYRRATAEQHQSAQYWLTFLGIDDLAECGYNLLSYGQKRLVLLARALVKSPQLLLLDEPCQGLDNDNRYRLLQTVSRVSRKRGIQVVFITHRLDEIPDTISHILEFRKDETGGYTAYGFKRH